jgi:hypothetical protein
MPGIPPLGKRFIFKRFGGCHYSSDDFTVANDFVVDLGDAVAMMRSIDKSPNWSIERVGSPRRVVVQKFARIRASAPGLFRI